MAKGDELRVNKRWNVIPKAEMICERESAASNICSTHTIRKDAKNEATRCSLTQETFTVLSFSLWCHLCHKQLRAQNPFWQTARSSRIRAGSRGLSRCWSLSNEQQEYMRPRPFWIIAIFNFNVNLRDTHASRPDVFSASASATDVNPLWQFINSREKRDERVRLFLRIASSACCRSAALTHYRTHHSRWWVDHKCGRFFVLGGW